MSAARAGGGRQSPPLRRALPSAEEVARGPLPPVVLLCGEEEYLLEEAFRRFWDHATDPAMADFNRDMFQADEVNREELFSQAASFPMMAERRLVALRRCEKASAALLADLANYLEHPSPSTCLLLTASSVDKRRKVWTRVAELGQVYEFAPLPTEQLAQWLVEACAARGNPLAPALAHRLAEQLGPSPLRMAEQEVEKLCLLAGEQRPIEGADLATALGMEPGADNFALVDAILARQETRALAILPSLLQQPDTLYTLTPLLGKSLSRFWFMRQLQDRGLSEDQIAAKLGLNAWLVRKNLQFSRNWPLPRLESAVQAILDVDLGLKGESPLAPPQQLFQLVLRLCRIQ